MGAILLHFPMAPNPVATRTRRVRVFSDFELDFVEKKVQDCWRNSSKGFDGRGVEKGKEKRKAKKGNEFKRDEYGRSHFRA
ncbi:hypothetical protein K0M31_003010 [Melipona bicolor]|uniref:Uncharacterized protein n=1 Tax=Melipona bicolor TaxID=60889 RepID=A0AA40G073_9HYME|nr:hypothetical protein K0M31_003010 [Melipona bicolor]